MTLENELGSLAAKSLQKLCCLAKCNTTNEIRCLILIVPAEPTVNCQCKSCNRTGTLPLRVTNFCVSG